MRKGRTGLISQVVTTLLSLAEEGRVDPQILPHLHVQLDWIQYKSNFREMVMVRKSIRNGAPSPLVELAIDLRQVNDESLRSAIEKALIEASTDGEAPDRIFLEAWGPMRSSIIWRFNELYWRHLIDWENASGQSYEKALPSGSSDGHNPKIIADQVREFYGLIREMDTLGQLPPELYVMEIGVGSGERPRQWLTRFQELDQEQGTGYYPRIRFLLCDYSMVTLERAMDGLGPHRHLGVPREVDAKDPFHALGELRYKVLYIHLTNVYDNLPTDDAVLRDGRFYFVEVRPYLSTCARDALASRFGVAPEDFPATIDRLIETGPGLFDDHASSMAFWMELWGAIRLEERLVTVDNLLDARLPVGLKPSHLEELVTSGPGTVRFQLSSGAVGSFSSTIQLLHPRGYLQVMDIFVTHLTDYRGGFKGPGKLDGSVVNWVNGALLAEIGRQSGYDVHFVPFTYREGSRTSILYTTHREK
jgi:hypothetical protein